jgi:hypothetical protein
MAACFVHPGVVSVAVDDIPKAQVAVAYRAGNASALITAFVAAALQALPASTDPARSEATA